MTMVLFPVKSCCIFHSNSRVCLLQVLVIIRSGLHLKETMSELSELYRGGRCGLPSLGKLNSCTLYFSRNTIESYTDQIQETFARCNLVKIQ